MQNQAAIREVTVDKLPLLALFTRLRDAGLLISIDEYELALQALHEGFGIANYQDLKSLCQALWVKSEDDLHRFNYHFDKVMARELARLRSQASARLARRRQRIKIVRNLTIACLFFIGVGIAIRFGSLPRVSVDVVPVPDQPTNGVPEQPNNGVPEQPNNGGNSLGLRFWVALVLGALLVTTITVWLITQRMIAHQIAQESFLHQASLSDPQSELTQLQDDESQAFQIIQQANSRVDEVFGAHPLLLTDYLPVSRRQMKQSWRYLRRFVREGPAVELDLEATINHISRQGVLLDPILRPRRFNQSELLILIDWDGSMVPFHALSQRLAHTAIGGGRISQSKIYYFHNYPIADLYTTPTYQEAVSIPDMLAQLSTNRASILIFSDAGAARRGFSLERIELTATFLMQLKQRVRYIAWLNPVPRSTWTGTTAEAIAKFVPMFELSRRGLDNALGVLRGQIR